jgi:hypothetical protein
MRRRIGLGAAALALGIVLVAAGCGQSGGPGAEGDSQFEIRTVAATTEAAGTARMEGLVEPSKGSGSPTGRFEGEIDFAAGNSTVRSRYDATGDEGPHETETRTVDGYIYFKTPAEAAGKIAAFGDKPWYRVPLPGSGIGMLPMGSSGDVIAYLEVLESMGARAAVAGTETVRGVPATRYRVTPGAPPAVPAQVQVLDEFTFDEEASGSIDIWADEQGRLRRLRSEFGAHGDGGGSGRYEVDVFDYGTPVTIEAPPVDQVADPAYGQPDRPAYGEVASGGSNGASWRLFASVSDDEQCYAVEADVPRYVSAVLNQDDGRIDLGCSSSATGVAGPVGDPDKAVQTSFVAIEPQAVPLADGRALLVSNAPEGTTAVTLRLRGGGEREVALTGGYFGAVLAHGDVAETIVFTTASGTKRCRLVKRYGYDCDDASGSPNTSSSSDGSGSDSSSSPTTTAAPATTPR